VTVFGEVDEVTGMVMDASVLKDIMTVSFRFYAYIRKLPWPKHSKLIFQSFIQVASFSNHLNEETSR